MDLVTDEALDLFEDAIIPVVDLLTDGAAGAEISLSAVISSIIKSMSTIFDVFREPGRGRDTTSNPEGAMADFLSFPTSMGTSEG